jgi:dipeptidyl aminopeptidase/acylaminoacyl peptidase
MSDYNSSLPIRTENNGDAAVKVVDGTTPAQALAVDASGRVTVKNADGAGNALTSQANGGQQALDVGINVAGAQIDPRSIRALTNADVVTAEQGAPGTAANGWFTKVTDGTDTLAISATGEASVVVTSALPAGNNNIGDVDANMRDGAGTSLTSTLVNSKQSLDVQTSANGVDGSAVPFGTMQVGGTDGTNLQAISVDTSGKVKVDLFDATGTAFSAGNPLPVSVVNATPGSEVLAFNQATAVAANASSTHTYTPTTGTTLTLQQVVASASGKMKIEIKIGPTGSEVTKAVLFNSTANPNVAYTFAAPQAIADTESILVIRTNKDNQAQDLYSTIEGVEN